jgi:hypothetical protein
MTWDALQLDTVKLSEDRSYLEILDQTLLPGTIRVLKIGELKDVWEAINVLRVRGAPAIGVTAAYAAAMCAGRIETDDPEAFYREFLREKEYLATARPTAVNLFLGAGQDGQDGKGAPLRNSAGDQGSAVYGGAEDPGRGRGDQPRDRRDRFFHAA